MEPRLPAHTITPSLPDPAGWTRGRKTGVVVLALGIAVLVPAIYQIARPFLAAIVLAGILAVALSPLQNWLGRFVSRSSLAALITTLVATGPILALIFVAGGLIERELKSGAFSGILSAAQQFTESPAIHSKVAQEAAAQIPQIGRGLFTVGMAVVFLYVLLVHGKNWLVQLTALLPLEAAVTNRIVSTARDAIVANVDGIVAVAAAQAVLFGVIFWLAGIDSPIPWGALAGLASMLPVVGGTVVWLPMAVNLGIHGTWVRALVMGLGCLVGQTAISELLRPRVVGKRLRQSSLLIALSVIGATAAFGASGILLGPVIVSILAALVHELQLQLQPNSNS
jgi:predicted PurR-regulated permease PerM